jgi:hypothetical protein
MAIPSFGYCGKLQRSTTAGGTATFDDVCYVTDLAFPKPAREAIDLTDTGACEQEGGYARSMPSPLRTLDATTFTINYDPDDLNHLKIEEDFKADHSPDSCHVWQWITPTGVVRWRCAGYVTDVQQMASTDSPLQLQFTLQFTGKPMIINK